MPCLTMCCWACSTRAASCSAGHDSPCSSFHAFVLTSYRRAVVYTSMPHLIVFVAFLLSTIAAYTSSPASSHHRPQRPHRHLSSSSTIGTLWGTPDISPVYPPFTLPALRTRPVHDLICSSSRSLCLVATSPARSFGRASFLSSGCAADDSHGKKRRGELSRFPLTYSRL